MPFSFLRRGSKSKSSRSKLKYRNLTSYSSLEPRHLLAGIFFDSGSGEITVSGNSSDNIGALEQIDASTVRASLNGFTSQDYALSSVNKIVFIGFGGDDQFTNGTAIEGLLLGNDGNDVLIGGSGYDQINGGNGNDEIRGNEGNDRLIGANGDDTVYGGLGDDSMYAGDGTNTMYGNEGDDTMFGGNQVDTLFGNDGQDGIFGLAGDDILDSGDGGVVGTPGISQADLVLGLDGNDTFVGGGGLNVFWGGNGNDTMTGTTGENRMHGQNGNDDITGGSGDDYLAGNLDDDILNGGDGNDFLLSGFGDDAIDAGTGIDYAVFTGNFDDYMITGTSTLTVYDTRGIHGTDTSINTNFFRFDDGDRPAQSGVTERVTIQPIIVSNDNGSNTSEYFGNSAEEAYIKAVIDEIYYQAGVDVAWLAPQEWDNTFANVGNSAVRPTGDLDTIVETGDAAGKGNSDPLILDVYFVEVSAGFSDQGENVANGLAYVGGNGVTMSVGDNLVDFVAGRDVIASVFAHEIGHNFGLEHVGGSDNLMSTSGNSTALTASQITQILNSEFTIPIT